MKKIFIISLILFQNFILSISTQILPKIKDKINVVPVAIIGSGPAGLSAGIYMGSARIPTLIFSGDMPGGQLMLTSFVENWPGISTKRGPEIIDSLNRQAKSFGSKVIDKTILKVDFSTWPFKLISDDNTEFNALSIIIATGSNPRKLNINGEEKYWGQGVSSCAVCDCRFYKDKDVAVVGGGDSAVEEAIQLSGYAKKVTIFVRKSYMKANALMQEKLAKYKNISVEFSKQVKEISGDNAHVKELVIEDTNTKSLFKFKVDGLFLAIGHIPNTQIFKNYLKLDPSGHIIADSKTKETSIKGIFAAGDVEDNLFKQAIVAGSSGCQAHFGVVKFLQSIGWNPKLNKKLTPCYYSKLRYK